MVYLRLSYKTWQFECSKRILSCKHFSNSLTRSQSAHVFGIPFWKPNSIGMASSEKRAPANSLMRHQFPHSNGIPGGHPPLSDAPTYHIKLGISHYKIYHLQLDKEKHHWCCLSSHEAVKEPPFGPRLWLLAHHLFLGRGAPVGWESGSLDGDKSAKLASLALPTNLEVEK